MQFLCLWSQSDHNWPSGLKSPSQGRGVKGQVINQKNNNNSKEKIDCFVIVDVIDEVKLKIKNTQE